MFDEYGPVMNVQDVCEALMIGKRSVYELIKEKKISSYRAGKVWKITKESLEHYVLRESNLPLTNKSRL